MKRIFSILASVMLLLTICVPEVLAATIKHQRVRIGKLYYNLFYDKTAEVTHMYQFVKEDNYEDLKEASIPSSVTYTKDGKTYTVTSIGDYAFNSAKNLEKATIPSTVTSIGYNAFAKSGLQSITIPTGSVTKIGQGVFDDTPFYDNSSNWTDGVLSVGNYLIEVKNNVKKLEVKGWINLLADDCCNENTSLEYVSLPNTVEYIGVNAFSGCTKLETVIMSNKVKVIDNNAFSQCEKLKSIDLPNTCESIGSCAFEGCSSLTEITLPENPENTKVYWKTFGDCTNLTKVVLPKQITHIDQQAFLNCNSLKYIYCNGKPKQIYEFTFDYVDTENITVYFPERHKAFYEKNWKGFHLVPLRFTEDGIYYELNDSKKTAIVVPERDDADNYKSLSGSILIDKFVKADGETFTINGMAPKAFKFSKISRITIDAAINEIPADAFIYNINLTDAVLPKSVTSIGERAFSGCSSLELVPGLTNDQKDLLPNVDKIGNSAFSGCAKLPKLRLLTETEIGEWAFSGCKGVKDIILGPNVKTIGANAFKECNSLESLTNYASTPQAFTTNMISGVDKGKFVVYVQHKDIDKYKAAAGWKEFTIKPIEGETQYTLIVVANDPEGGTVTGGGTYYAGTEVTITAIPNEGWHFVRWANGSTSNPLTSTLNSSGCLVAFFEKDTKYYDILVRSSNVAIGWVEGGAEHVEEGQKVTIEAGARSGYEFTYWTDSRSQVVSGQATYEVTVTGDETYTAHFRVQPPADAYTLWVCGTQVTGSNSRDILGDGVWSYDDATRTLTVMKDATYNITNDGFIEDWAGSSTSEPLLVNVGNHKIEATCTTTDNTIRNGIVGTKGMTFTGTTYHGITFTAQNMYAANFSKPLTVTGHMDLTLNLKNTTDWGKDNFKTAILLAGVTPSLIVDGANLYINSGVGESAGLGYKVTNKTDQAANLSLNNASIQWGSINDKSLGILDESPQYEINYLTPSLESLCLTSVFGLSFYEGTYVTLRAYPLAGYKFVSWSDGNTDNPRLIIMPAHNVYLDPIVEEDGSLTPDGAFVNAYAPAGEGTIIDFEGGWFATGTELTITAQAEEGYRFVQWSDGETTNPRVLIVEAGKDISIDAEFEQIPRYTVTFLDWDDEVLTTEKVYEGESATAPEEPYREGYTFTGWDSSDWTDVQTDLIVKAQFEINTYTVRFFDINEELMDEQTVNWNEAAMAPEAPEVEGYTFTGWSEEFSQVTCDLDVYALYELNNPEEGIESVQNPSVNCKKFIQDGILYIDRNGKTYNALGAEIK